MIERYHRLPEWLRWVLFVPVTLLLTAVVCEAAAWLAGRHYFIIRQAVAVGFFVLFAYLLAPRWQKRIAIGLFLLRVAFFVAVMFVILGYRRATLEDLQIEIVREILGWISAASILLVLFRMRVRMEGKAEAAVRTNAEAAPRHGSP